MLDYYLPELVMAYPDIDIESLNDCAIIFHMLQYWKMDTIGGNINIYKTQMIPSKYYQNLMGVRNFIHVY